MIRGNLNLPEQDSDYAHVLYKWNPRPEPAASWGRRVSEWLLVCERFDRRLSDWVASRTGEPVPTDPELLTELLTRLGGMKDGGAQIPGALSLAAHTPPPGLARLLFYAHESSVDSASMHRVDVSRSETSEIQRIMAFVTDSPTALGARWGALRFGAQLDALRQQEIDSDHAGWITYYSGVAADRLSHLRAPAVGEATDGGVVVASVPSLVGATGTSLAEAGRRIERDLFGA